MYARFKATELVKILAPEAQIPIQHYLRQPHRLVTAITNPQLMTKEAENLYNLKMRPINFMEIYHFQPTVKLKVKSDAKGTVFLSSQECHIEGIDYINRRFSLKLKGILYPKTIENKTMLHGQADLEVGVDVPAALVFTPKALVEMTGNGLLKSILGRIKQRLVTQLLQDYQEWAATEINIQEPSKSQLSADYGF
ncbi:Protein of unknown function (DUF1997) [Xenococcus sp. PCC 7305]|uniref:DUF1997 domain-containing protein n=1 Tax=Xenococcus sp. PCC 7305 TaxID=102125 RepID=UPI0002AC4E44|nr:DUF1997 domain-containing protein [Xenococcus sp. PCC 7305]ELS01396.1 Protein of unknown function (DUF1997) [Xenococcus sp. PCC 7305]